MLSRRFGLQVGLTTLAFCLGGVPPSRSIACDSAACCCQNPAAVTVARSGASYVADSPNFQVCSLSSEAEARRVALHCECWRTQLVATWGDGPITWAPRCQVVLHPTVAAYRRAVGPGAEATLGSSLTTPARGPIRGRRIDLRTDVDDVLVAALPHELCHLVLADRFRDAPAPLWFDEGVALQYDPAAKRRLHDRDLQSGLQRGTALPLSELLAQRGYPSADRWGEFYGQSASLVRFLLTKGSPQDLVDFVVRSRDVGSDLALRETYQIADVDRLYGQWRRNSAPFSAGLPAKLSIPSTTPLQVAAR